MSLAQKSGVLYAPLLSRMPGQGKPGTRADPPGLENRRPAKQLSRLPHACMVFLRFGVFSFNVCMCMCVFEQSHPPYVCGFCRGRGGLQCQGATLQLLRSAERLMEGCAACGLMLRLGMQRSFGEHLGGREIVIAHPRSTQNYSQMDAPYQKKPPTHTHTISRR